VDEREGPTQGGHAVSTEVAERVRAVISAAEAAASALRHEADQESQARRRSADEEARQYLEDARRDAEAFLRERQRRISELSDEIVERSEHILTRLDRAEEVRSQLQELVDALGQTARQLARDAADAVPAGRGPEPVAEPDPRPEPRLEAVPADEPPLVETEPVLDAEPADEPQGDPDYGAATSDVASAPSREAEDDDLAARLVALQMAVAGANRGEVESYLALNFGLSDPERILNDVFGRGSESAKRVSWPNAVGESEKG
jgi:hypothetical protein